MILKYNEFILEEFKETPKNTPFLYKDNNLEVKVVKTLDSSKEIGKDTAWCSNKPDGFYSHNKTANMYRFIFKDGFKLRLTWDYITQRASQLGRYSGGTHWGQGGTVNHENIFYLNIRPKDEENPFDFDIEKEDIREDKHEMVNRILSIPDEAKLLVYEYQEKHIKEKNALISNLYKEIEKIKILGVKIGDFDKNYMDLIIDIEYLGNKENIKLTITSGGDYWVYKKFKFKNNYNNGELDKYIYNNTMGYLKKHNLTNILSKIKNHKVEEEEYDDYED